MPSISTSTTAFVGQSTSPAPNASRIAHSSGGPSLDGPEPFAERNCRSRFSLSPLPQMDPEMLEGGSLVGNESASVLSWFFSRIERLCSGRVGRSSGSRGVMFSSARLVFGSASLFLTQNSRASVRRTSDAASCSSVSPLASADRLASRTHLSSRPCISVRREPPCQSRQVIRKQASPLREPRQPASCSSARSRTAPTSSTRERARITQRLIAEKGFAALRQRPTGRTPGA